MESAARELEATGKSVAESRAESKKPVLGHDGPHLAQLRELQEENARLKRMYADLALMHSALRYRSVQRDDSCVFRRT